ncbi:D-alanyl-D-alanine carboxypeptidase family protein [Streptococcus merionis]|uniref:D-alanyl-D-alanine carboxypeptidase family protein n=1 Tax=Streptococcus merionis TaxID=400065 RepID=UPI003512DA76
MLKRMSFVITSLLILSLSLGNSRQVLALESHSELELAKEMGQDLEAKYAPKGGSIVIDAATGQVLYEREADKQWPVASLTKIMTLYLAYEALESGELSRDMTFEVTQKDVDISQISALSNNTMVLGAQYTFDELAQLMMIVSSNAATVLMADTIAGDEGAFVDLMNAKAKELGMTQTQFYNASGSSNELLGDYAPANQPKDGENKGSARDFALLSYHLIKDYPQALKNTSQYNLSLKEGSEYEESFTAHHLSLVGGPTAYEGTDGLKTGSSDSAGYNLVSTVKRQGVRLISVVMGVGEWPDDKAEEARNRLSNALHDAVYKEYTYQRILPRGFQTINDRAIVLEEDLYAMVRRGEKLDFTLENGQVTLDDDAVYISEDTQQPSAAYRIWVAPKPDLVQLLRHTWLRVAYQWWLVGTGSFVLLIVGIYLLRGGTFSRKRKGGRSVPDDK